MHFHLFYILQVLVSLVSLNTRNLRRFLLLTFSLMYLIVRILDFCVVGGKVRLSPLPSFPSSRLSSSLSIGSYVVRQAWNLRVSHLGF